MSEAEDEETIRRILVALDASPHSLAALRVAVDLASHLGAELQGVYVEDITMLRLSEHPFSRRVSSYTTQPRQLDREHVQQELRAQARQAGRELARTASNAHLRWSFRVAQGVITRELLTAAQGADLLLVGKAGWSRRRRLGSTAQALVQEAPVRVMVLQQGARISLPIGVLHDGSEAAQKALRTAASLLQDNGFIVVFIMAPDPESARSIQSEAAALLRERDIPARFRWLVGNPSRLLELYTSESCGLLVLPGGNEFFEGEALTEIVNRMQCPVLLIR